MMIFDRTKFNNSVHIKCSESGQLLIEAMIAVGVVTIGLLGVFSLLSQSMGLNKVASDEYVGAYLASEGIEVTKNIIDTNSYGGGAAWNSGVGDGTYALQYDSMVLSSSDINAPLKFDKVTGTYNYTTGVNTNFKRTIKITSLRINPADPLKMPNELQVESIVDWNDRGGVAHEVHLEDHFMNWR